MDSLSSKHPLLILKELEQVFSVKHSPDEDSKASAGSGLGVSIGSHECIIENHNIQEILLPEVLNNLSRVPGAKSWLKGLISIRGQAMPIIDLGKFLFNTVCITSSATRVLIINFNDFTGGILIDKSLGLKRLEQNNIQSFSKNNTDNERMATPCFKQALKSDTKVWPILDITELGKSPDFRNMAGG